ncbi:diguanylate cyclase (GGDEF)-like protein [Acetivibrio thermocellus AD2]|uniref:Diguanylate cyclase (GGDEF)-like protein n=1 Tax=Acetivibrio thermocellus AD2 TaxID=1138384 RepID=A0AB36TFS5_ACETH|nr:GGDEF domain-containing protein [Acetivibrio thermocellus]ALX08345.1 diguanylate cyclase [Acetivibrio thermocellus AD2]PFH02618.1 diguanylate cyclase (GGDEF)-like protein [Acetivibrio thermocellus AD2]UWV48288.1 GGDEF domain-containing protein [Acetivibrio thermocellus]
MAILYNGFQTLLILFKRPNGWVKKFISIAFYFDIMFICAFSYILNGIESDIYILIFFVISYYGIGKDVSSTINISIFSIILYTVSSIAVKADNIGELNFLKLIIRDFFILLVAYGVSMVILEVKKYDEMHQREFKLARTDKLTGLANRHMLDQKLEEEALYCEYSKKPLNVLMFDIDDFKKFNDTYGHIWGDKLLSLFGDIIKQSIRKTDMAFRYGGEEFMVLIRDLDLEKAKCVADRIRCQLEKQNLFSDEGHNMGKATVSCGIAQFPTHSDDIKKVVDYADRALYYAKKIGKNIVVSYDEIGKLTETVQINADTYLSK